MLIAKAIKARKHKDLDLQVKYIHLETCTRDFFQLRHVLPINLKLLQCPLHKSSTVGCLEITETPPR